MLCSNTEANTQPVLISHTTVFPEGTTAQKTSIDYKQLMAKSILINVNLGRLAINSTS